MEITGRLPADAEKRTAKGNREFVTFTVAVNDYYKTKGGEEKEFTEYINCAYWLGTKIADSLLKGSIVTVIGRIYLNQYKGNDGENHASLAFHANQIKIIAKGGKKATVAEPIGAGIPSEPPIEDLPF